MNNEPFADVRNVQAWATYVTPYTLPPSGHFADMLVPTTDLIRASRLLSLAASQGAPVMLVGEPGSAKTVTMAYHVASLDTTTTNMLPMVFSRRTSSLALQCALEVC